MRLWTDAIDRNGFFDARYTCDIDNSSPELHWDSPPTGAASFVLVAEEQPESGPTLTPHTIWLVYDIPGDIRHLPTGIPAQDTLPHGIHQGINDHGKLGYTGPCPPQGSGARSYTIRIYALLAAPLLTPRLNRKQLFDAINPLIIGAAEVVGNYRRSIQRAG